MAVDEFPVGVLEGCGVLDVGGEGEGVGVGAVLGVGLEVPVEEVGYVLGCLGFFLG